MTIGESFRKAYEIVGKNWPLVLINMAMGVVVMVMFIAFVILPLMSITGGQDLHYTFQSPSQLKDFLSGGNFKTVIMAAGLLILWLILASVAWIYVYAGAVGMMKEALWRDDWRFSLRGFFRQGAELFWPITGYIGLLFLLAIAVILVWVVLSIVLAFLGSTFKTIPQGGMAVLVSVLGVFFFLLSLFLGFAFVLLFASLNAYGSVIIAFRDAGVVGALKKSLQFLCSTPRAFWGYVFSIGIILVVGIILAIGGLVVGILPVVGPVFALPYNVFSWSVQIYMAYWSTAVAMAFYHSERQVAQEEYHPLESGQKL